MQRSQPRKSLELADRTKNIVLRQKLSWCVPGTETRTMWLQIRWSHIWLSLLFFFPFFFFGLFRGTHEAYGSSQARGQIGGGVAGLFYSSQQVRILNPLSEARDGTLVLINTTQVSYCWATTGTPLTISTLLPTFNYQVGFFVLFFVFGHTACGSS